MLSLDCSKTRRATYELPVKVQAPGAVLRAGPQSACSMQGMQSRALLAQHLRAASAPRASPGSPCPSFCHDDLQHLLGLSPLERVLREEEHAHAVVPLAAQGDALAPRLPSREEPVGDLDHQIPRRRRSCRSASLPARCSSFSTIFRALSTVAWDCAALDVHHGADAAGIMLKLRIIQPLLGAAFRSEFFHNVSPFRRKNAPTVRDSARARFPRSPDCLPIEAFHSDFLTDRE